MKTKHCFLVINHLIDMDDTDDVISEVKANITNFKQLQYMSAVRYSDVYGIMLYNVVVYMKRHL